MKRLIAGFLSVCVAVSLLMTGCSSGGTGNASQTDGPVTITIWHDKEDEVAQALQAELDTLAPDIVVKLEKKDGLTDSLKMVGNDPKSAPDMYFFAHDKIGVYAEMGILAPITDFVDKSTLDQYIPMTVEAATYKGEVYQLPLYFETLLYMNYDFRKHCRRFFAEQSIDAAEFDARVSNMRMRYKLPVLYAQLNLLDSHDVSRFYSLCEKDPARMQLAVLFQMTFTGIPSVFYGDERGIYGLLEAEYRHEMTWSQEPPALADFYKKAMHLRTEHPALCRGGYHTVEAGKKKGLYGYERADEKEKITVFLNNQIISADLPTIEGKILWQQGYEAEINCLAPMGFAIFVQGV